MHKTSLQCLHPTCRGGCAGASILAVVPALVNLTSVSSVIRLATTLGLLVGIQETAATVQTLDQAGTTGRSCKRWRFFFSVMQSDLDASVHVCVCSVCWSMCLLTDRRQCGSGQLHTCAIVQRASIGTGADWSAGAQQTQPFTFLPVAGVSH